MYTFFFPFSKVVEHHREREKRKKKVLLLPYAQKTSGFPNKYISLLILRLSLVKKGKMQQSPRSKKTFLFFVKTEAFKLVRLSCQRRDKQKESFSLLGDKDQIIVITGKQHSCVIQHVLPF